MIRRTVLIRSARPERIDRALARVAAAADGVACLSAFQRAADTGGRARGFDRMFVLEFATAADVAAWREHPVHVALRTVLEQDAELLVFEYDYAAPDAAEDGRLAA